MQDRVLARYCASVIPLNYKDERSFRQTIQRKIEDYCPQAQGFDESKRDGKFLRIGRGFYRGVSGQAQGSHLATDEAAELGAWFEGGTTRVYVNAYERNAKARAECIAHYGLACSVCGFDFEKRYGEIGKSFIHVHHLVPLSEVKETYQVNPINDLRPVCANCHAIIHRTNPALTLDQVRQAITGPNTE